LGDYFNSWRNGSRNWRSFVLWGLKHHDNNDYSNHPNHTWCNDDDNGARINNNHWCRHDFDNRCERFNVCTDSCSGPFCCWNVRI
jgi:hypothetical protein